jgi:hypothetical protein
MDKTPFSSSGSFLNQILARRFYFFLFFTRASCMLFLLLLLGLRLLSSSSSFEVQCTLSQNKILFVNNSTPARFFEMHRNFLRTGKEKKEKK